MKKILLMLMALSLLACTGCGDIPMDDAESKASEVESPADTTDESDGSVQESTLSAPESDIEVDSSVPESETESDSSTPESESVSEPDSSVPESEVIVDKPESNSSAPESEVIVDKPVIDDYAIRLSDEEIKCINAGANGEYLILVNKENKLPADFVPENLVDIRKTRGDRAPEKMVYTAEVALNAFLKEATYYGHGDVTITSGYRSIAKQESLFNYYVSQEMASGKDKASAEAAASVYSAYPGTSEHHTGLCADMHNLPAASQNFGSTEAAKWMAANAHRFGFILRFPQGKQDITGYMWEPWHFRFVGIEHATNIYESGLTLEEYLKGEAEVG